VSSWLPVRVSAMRAVPLEKDRFRSGYIEMNRSDMGSGICFRRFDSFANMFFKINDSTQSGVCDETRIGASRSFVRFTTNTGIRATGIQ
jgi:hypothetical protein